MMCMLWCSFTDNEVIVRNALLTLLQLTTNEEFCPAPKALNLILRALLELASSVVLVCFGRNRNLHQIVLKVVRQIMLENVPLLEMGTINFMLEISMQWIEIDKDAFKGTVKALPTRADVTLPIREQLIIELYSK